MGNKWTKVKIIQWIHSQNWYQRIRVNDEIITPGKIDDSKRLKLMNLGDLTGKSVLDVGCNSGLYCFESKRRGASEVIGIDINEFRLNQARTLAEIINLDIVFKKMNIEESIKLGQFDIVFCIAVVTEITNLISSLLVLKQLTKETLFLELDISPIPNLPIIYSRSFKKRRISGKCYLSKISRNRWSLIPNKQFIKVLLGDKLKIKVLGKSSRYTLLRCDVK